VALNCVGNGRILREGPFEDLWIQPAAGDAGGALGVALLIWHGLLGKPRAPLPQDAQRGSLLGPQFSAEQIRAFLDATGARYRAVDREEDLLEEVAGMLASGRVVGWLQGRMEFGPRALGGRSILGDARDAGMQSRMNLKIKFRESFRPFAPVVLQERAHEYFVWPAGKPGPYMLLTAQVNPERLRAASTGPAPSGARPSGLERLKEVRSEIPAVTHVDASARLQTVDAGRHGRFYELLKRFEQKTGCPVLINTSFNVRGEPIVCSPEDAWRCFMATNMDALVLERFVLRKEDQPDAAEIPIDTYLAEHRLD
jgi:carbamoyltransferase